MKRRAFITLLGGAAAAWPLAARAQRERIRHVGVLMSSAESDPEAQTWMAAFKEGRRGSPTRSRNAASNHFIPMSIGGSISS
jgi:hypothetical protein